MNSKMRIRIPASMVCVALSAALLIGVPLVRTQTPPASRFLGTVTAINGATLTVKTDAGEVHQVDVPPTASIKRIAPGQKDLSTAESIQFSDLASGDRVLVKLDPDAPGPNGQALQIVAVKQADVALKQQKDREDWQLRGVGGLVKSVDSANGVIVLTSGAGATAKTITVNTTKASMLKRYAPASVSFDAALPAPIDAIHAGDQLRARGVKNADGTQIAAEEVISGTFRNISGAISSLDAASSTLVVKDLATKKQFTIHITPEAQMRRLPDRMAQMLAARLKGTSSGSTGSGGNALSAGNYSAQTQRASGRQGGNGGGQGGGGSRPGAQSDASGQSAGTGGGQSGGQGGGQAGAGAQWAGQGGGDPEQMLSRAPVIQLADLKKGDAVMLVATDGATEVTAITLLAGVEPLLEAPAASQSLLNNWSMNSGAGAADAAVQ
jgi:hypothetical protein